MQPFWVTTPFRVFIPISTELQNEHLGTGDKFVFDQLGHPWVIDRREHHGIYLIPTLPTINPENRPVTVNLISSFTAQTDGAKLAAKRRLLDALTSIEALDRTITKIRACQGLKRYDLSYPGCDDVLTFHSTLNPDEHFDEMLSEHKPTMEATITDSEGFVWGPITLDPFKPVKPEAQWPFPATIGKVKLRPLGRGNRMEVTYGPFHTTLETMDAIRFANNVAVHGVERAVEDMFPNGARLGAGNPS